MGIWKHFIDPWCTGWHICIGTAKQGNLEANIWYDKKKFSKFWKVLHLTLCLFVQTSLLHYITLHNIKYKDKGKFVLELSSRPRALVALLQTQKISFLIWWQIQLEYQAWGKKGKKKKGEEKGELKVRALAKSCNFVSFWQI